jgi:hypothetical protein
VPEEGLEVNQQPLRQAIKPETEVSQEGLEVEGQPLRQAIKPETEVPQEGLEVERQPLRQAEENVPERIRRQAAQLQESELQQTA